MYVLRSRGRRMAPFFVSASSVSKARMQASWSCNFVFAASCSSTKATCLTAKAWYASWSESAGTDDDATTDGGFLGDGGHTTDDGLLDPVGLMVA